MNAIRSVAIALLIPCAQSALAQSISVSEAFEIIDPTFTVSVLRQQLRNPGGVDICNVSPTFWECGALPRVLGTGGLTAGFDAVGNVYHVAVNGDGPRRVDFGDGRKGWMFQRTTPSGATEDLAKVFEIICFDDPLCDDNLQFSLGPFVVDVTNGRILVPIIANRVIPGVNPNELQIGIVEIRGLPQMFDTLLTFIPSGQGLNALTPAHPDGFRSADAVQVWTGDAHAMPDWSLAQPLTCEATTSPSPGQLVSVDDTLPDPPIGSVRYYITASQSGPNRRLGRQHMAGAFTARDPTLLPTCTP